MKIEGCDFIKINRVIAIIMILLREERISATKLSEMLEVSTRTIYRDIETISLAGIPIVTYSGVNGGIGIMSEYKISKGLFTISDVSSLLMGLNSINSSLSDKEIINTIVKIKGLIPIEHRRDIEEKMNQILIDHRAWFKRKEDEIKLESLRRAIEDKKLVSFSYLNQVGGESERVIEPYRVILKNSNWYIQGYCLEKENFRIFKLSRISNCSILEEKFIPRKFDYAPVDSLYLEERHVTRVKLLVDKSIKDTLPNFCKEEDIKPYGDKKYIVNFPFIENDFNYGMLLKFGDKCECLEPEYIREELRNRIKRLMNLYQE